MDDEYPEDGCEHFPDGNPGGRCTICRYGLLNLPPIPPNPCDYEELGTALVVGDEHHWNVISARDDQ